MSTKTLPDHTAPLPVGALVDASTAREPKALVLKGRYGRVEKLDPARHKTDLWLAFTGHDQIWTYMAYGPFADADAFGLWLKARAGITDPFSYVILDNDGRAAGIMALMAVRPEMRVIEIGNILLSPALQRTALATEAQYLLARYVFESLGYRRYEWKCDSRNAASRRAALRLGFNFEGLSWQHMIIKGRNRDTACTRCWTANGPPSGSPSSAGSRPRTSTPKGVRRSGFRTRPGRAPEGRPPAIERCFDGIDVAL